MKRDCGEGELIPAKYFLRKAVGMADKESKQPLSKEQFNSFDLAGELKKLPPCSFLGLYAEDKQGYANVIFAGSISKDGQLSIRQDRRNEL